MLIRIGWLRATFVRHISHTNSLHCDLRFQARLERWKHGVESEETGRVFQLCGCRDSLNGWYSGRMRSGLRNSEYSYRPSVIERPSIRTSFRFLFSLQDISRQSHRGRIHHLTLANAVHYSLAIGNKAFLMNPFGPLSRSVARWENFTQENNLLKTV
jgi:hypothetical protein